MSTLPFSRLIQALADLFIEAYDGPPDPHATWWIDNQPDCGILGILKDISAAQASRSVDGSGKAGSTIASNAEHLRWSMANANGALRGEPYRQNWSESWAIIGVDDAQWDRLRNDLRSEYETLRDAIQKQEDLQGDFLLGVMALVPHAAFHLGVLRQMIERVCQG